MPDPRSVMQEFRTLEAKRLAKGLSPEEERRLGELRDLVGNEAGAGAPRGGFDVNAAAARLRESLLPAGLRNRPPPPPELSPEPEPEPFFPAPALPAPALDEAPPAAPGEPLFADADAAALFDPATLGWESEPAAGAQPPHEFSAPEAAAWDASAGWDPTTASAQGWDPSALPGDGAAWDPASVPVDASGQPWEAGALPPEPFEQAWAPDPSAVDPNGQPWDPNAVPADPGGWDPNALAWSEGSAGGDPAAAGGWEPSAYAEPTPATPGGAPWDAGAPLFDPATLGVDPAGDLATDVDADGGPLDLDAGASELEPLEDAALVLEHGVASQAPSSHAATAGWTVPAPAAAIPDGFALEDAAIAPEPTEMLGLASEPEPTQALPLFAADPAPLPPAGWDPAPAPAFAEPTAFGDYDELAAPLAELVPADGAEALDGLDVALPGLEPTLASDPSAPLIAPAAGDLGEYDDTAGFAPGAVFEPPADGGIEAGAPLALIGEASSALGGAAPWPGEGALDPSFELASGGSFDAAADAAAGWSAAQAPAPWEAPPVDGALEPLSLDLPAFAPAPEPEPEPGLVTQSHSLAPPRPQVGASEDDLALPEIVEEIPTIEGEEILEEIPADEAALPLPPLDFTAPPPVAPQPAAPHVEARPPAAALPAPALTRPAAAGSAPVPPPPRVAPASPAPAAARAAGAHRVVVHTLEGTVRRGVIEDADLAGPALALAPAPGEAAEPIATDRVKAIFFMLAAGEAPPAAEGKKVRVTFRDGRQVAGFSPDYREDGAGFFMIPGDTRTNTGRIWVYRAAVKQVAVS